MSVIFAVTLCALLFLSTSLEAASSSTKIIIGHAAVNPRVVPLWIAQEQGFFARNGLDAEVVFIRTGPILISALTAGRINIGYAAGEALVLASAASGADVKIIAAFTSRFNHDVVARPGITRPQDLRGKRFEYNIVHDDGSVETLLRVNYHFHWQLSYKLAEPRVLKAGTKLRAIAWYDNSKNNPHNPDPEKTVTWGDQTSDEMMVGFFDVAIPAGMDKWQFFIRQGKNLDTKSGPGQP